MVWKSEPICEAARRRWRSRCPCCLRVMTDRKQKPGVPPPNTARTRGHDKPVAFGGDHLIWVDMCVRCNNTQGSRDLVQWARHLIRWEDERRGGPRAENVVALAVFVREWVAERDRRKANG